LKTNRTFALRAGNVFFPLQPQLQLIHLLSIPEKLKGGHVDATINKNSPLEWGIDVHLDKKNMPGYSCGNFSNSGATM
jgi:hypothetical protein